MPPDVPLDISHLDTPEGASPFHAGEQAIQARLGVRGQQEKVARMVMHDFIPDKQRRFFAELPLVVVGSVDSAGWPWASVVFGPPGFVATPDERTVAVHARAVPGDPLPEHLEPGAKVSFLGIAFHTRRRNRVNATVQATGPVEVAPGGFVARVDQFYGNCPKYIQARTPSWAVEPQAAADATRAAAPEGFTTLDAQATQLIRQADTFFVASHAAAQGPGLLGDTGGVDVNHRGGRAGFVKVVGNTLTIPDYAGNYLFNTLGNFVLNPKAGLLFTDFASGDVLQMVGTTEILADDHPEVRGFAGAHRAWRFHLDHGHLLPKAAPLRWTDAEESPFLARTGAWDDGDPASR